MPPDPLSSFNRPHDGVKAKLKDIKRHSLAFLKDKKENPSQPPASPAEETPAPAHLNPWGRLSEILLLGAALFSLLAVFILSDFFLFR